MGNTVTRPNSEKTKQFKGYVTSDDRGTGQFIDPLPLESGRSMLLAPDAPERMVKITSHDADLMLFDGRILAQNGWFVVRSLLPAGKTGKVLTWTVEPNAVEGWVREPNIGFSQVGYIPDQPKISVIELTRRISRSRLLRSTGLRGWQCLQVFTGKITPGATTQVSLREVRFHSGQHAGIYYIRYGDCITNNFIIEENVYDQITDATSDIWIPIT